MACALRRRELAELGSVRQVAQELDEQAHKAALNSQEAKQKAGDAVERQHALEQAVVANLNVSLMKAG